MSKLSERLKEYLEERQISQKELAEATNISPSNISDFLSEKHIPNYKNFISLLYFFNCSADYLLGLKDIHTEETLHPVPPFSERLRTMLKERNISQAKLIRELPVSSSLVYKWLKGLNEPLSDHLVRLSVYFDCTVDYLIGRVR